MSVTPRLRARVERDFGADAPEVCDLIASASPDERVQAAIVLGADGDVNQVRYAVALAEVDERDVFLFGGLAGRDWPERLDLALDGAQRPAAQPRRARRPVWIRGLVVLAVLLGGVLLPGLVLWQYVDQLARTSTADGVVTENRYVVSKVSGHWCTYTYDVDGATYEESDRCPEDVAVGAAVEVHHRPGDPASSHVWSERPLVYLAGGGLAWIVGVLVVLNHHRKRPR